MASFLIDAALDAALSYIDTNGTTLYICSQLPTNFTQASSTYKLGTKTGFGINAPVDGTSGRKITSVAITDGAVNATGTATHWAICSADTLLVAGTLSSSQSVTSGNTFTLPSFDILSLPDPS